VQLERPQGKVDPRRIALTSQKMADTDHITSNSPAQTPIPQRALPDGQVPDDREFAGGGEGNCPLWDGQIIDAIFPPV
jgi:hypothetical protein